MTTSPKISFCIPIHNMENGAFFLWRAVQSIMSQTFKDYEIIITQEGSMPVNTNAGIKKARGELIKILYMDDYLAHPNALQEIVDHFKGQWLVSGCLHDEDGVLKSPHYPSWNDSIHLGQNTIGSPSVLTIRNDGHLLFDETLSFLLDCDLYKRYYKQYGPPTILKDLNVAIGLHAGQTSNLMPQEEKEKEYKYIMTKYE